mmetsp:Transcript_38984/g.96515  ORF Transcript_38984/g.96515 Transcript_38984/m.96515 type:complete len:202 (-) Transcript_38984:169-774(-)
MVTVRLTGPVHTHGRPGGRHCGAGRAAEGVGAAADDVIGVGTPTVPTTAVVSPHPTPPAMGAHPPPPPPGLYGRPLLPEVSASKVRRTGEGAGLCARSVTETHTQGEGKLPLTLPLPLQATCVSASLLSPFSSPSSAPATASTRASAVVRDVTAARTTGRGSVATAGPSSVHLTSCRPAAAAAVRTRSAARASARRDIGAS